ncbi:two-component system sensor histidine kinase NtrB [Hydrogenothermus marinus]|uniref:histidine kinase n=1 Tax=Hydrogenothermus marinus TaxID=133270 RepID=A0A3M0BMR2_9AQUI|nr:ATP-binding protein [Hydrogenothermus marinus]RMA97764.1 phospho-acceptor domain-containing protein [Hydrogenothermus marinus]
MISVFIGLFPWISLFLVLRYLNIKPNPRIILIFLIYLLSLFLFIDNQVAILKFVLISYFLFLFLELNKNLDFKYKLIAIFWFVSLGILTYFEHKEINLEILIPLAILTLFLKRYKNITDFLSFNLINIILIISYYIDLSLFLVFSSIYAIYLITDYIFTYKKELEKENLEYKKLLDRAINTEVQKKIFQIDEDISITSKKLKEIFKLSNYTVSTTDLNAMAERAVEGLLSLGYTGIVISILKKDIFKKGGFFPNFKQFQEIKDISNLKKLIINEEEKYILLPFKVGDEILGFLAVYKKEGILPKETEYLSTYANSVAIAVANIIHFEDLINLEELTYKTFESLDIGIAVLDEDLNIQMANKAFRNMAVNEDKNNAIDIIPTLKYLEKDLKNVISQAKPFETVLSSINKKGFIYRIKALPLHIELPEKSKIILIIEDITEKEKLEAQLVETEKLAVIGKMAAVLAHEIKNPLTAISASAYRIKKNGEKLGNEKIIELSEKVEFHSDRAKNIIDRVLNYSKPSYYKLEKINLKDILNQTLEFINHSIKGKNIKIKKNIRKNVYVYGDKNSLQQVFVNLIMNSIEAIQDKSKDELEEGIIEINLDRENDRYAIVKIKDNGIGIPESILEDVFEPFFSTKVEGTGLGLSVVKRIITDHGGQIFVESKEGEGTEFIIKLPIED